MTSSVFYDPKGRRWPASAQYQEDGSVYLYVPRDERYWRWHKAYWNGAPEFARDKDYVTGLHWVAQSHADIEVSVMRAYYPETLVIGEAL